MRRRRRLEAHLINELRGRTERKFGLKKTAEELGMTSQFIADVIAGRRSVTERLASSMGYRRVIEFERVP